MAVLIALALFVAQAVNFALALRDRNAFRLAQATRPVAVRVADAIEREARGGRAIPRAVPGQRGRIRRATTNDIPATLPRMPDIASELRVQLREQGLEVGRIDTGVRPWTAKDEAIAGRRPPGTTRTRRIDASPDEALLIAIEQPGRGWISIIAPWGDGGGIRLFWRLFAQTLILYGIILVPILWVARRVAAPLRDLGASARAFRPGEKGTPVVERGPDDVRAVIAAYNTLGDRVTAMLDEKDRMLGAIGHDLRTPLAALRVRIESVEDETDRARMADVIDEMAKTLEDILSLARLGRPSEPPVDVDLAALVDAVVEDFRDLGADIVAEEVPRLTMRLRPALIRRAVRNLIENAIKYAGAVEVVVAPTATGACISVLDRGPGIPPDRIGSVFDAFVRVETSRNRDTGGIGLGLALARAIVMEAGGTIDIANREGGGLSATIELPRRID
ncbi:sensor histidine kinase [Sphingomonas sp. RS2018]